MSLEISYVSDVLCVWAWIAEVRLEQIRRDFASEVKLGYHFTPIFGTTRYKIGEGWKDRGGFAGFGAHVQEVASRFPHVSVDERIWRDVAPSTSGKAHEVLCAVRLVESERGEERNADGRTMLEEAIWRTRHAFFSEARDVSATSALYDVLESAAVPVAAVEKKMVSGQAMAEVLGDIELCGRLKIEGSPTYYLNQGRQKLYGNVGYRLVSANLRELLEQPGDHASWC